MIGIGLKFDNRYRYKLSALMVFYHYYATNVHNFIMNRKLCIGIGLIFIVLKKLVSVQARNSLIKSVSARLKIRESVSVSIKSMGLALDLTKPKHQPTIKKTGQPSIFLQFLGVFPKNLPVSHKRIFSKAKLNPFPAIVVSCKSQIEWKNYILTYEQHSSFEVNFFFYDTSPYQKAENKNLNKLPLTNFYR